MNTKSAIERNDTTKPNVLLIKHIQMMGDEFVQTTLKREENHVGYFVVNLMRSPRAPKVQSVTTQ